MGALVIEVVVVGLAVVVLIGVCVKAFIRYTKTGKRISQKLNKFEIDTNIQYECNVHGKFNEHEVIGIPMDGAYFAACPTCYQNHKIVKLEKI
jgi:hypothetical protein